MEPIKYQEILIAPSNNFFLREFFLKERDEWYTTRNPKEHLAEACWNGILQSILPEIASPLHLTHICEGNKFLNICLGEEDESYSVAFSINPYYFLNHSRKN